MCVRERGRQLRAAPRFGELDRSPRFRADAKEDRPVQRSNVEQRRRAGGQTAKIGAEMNSGKKTANEERPLRRRIWRRGQRHRAAAELRARRRGAIRHRGVLETWARHRSRHEFGQDNFVVEHEPPRGEKMEIGDQGTDHGEFSWSAVFNHKTGDTVVVIEKTCVFLVAPSTMMAHLEMFKALARTVAKGYALRHPSRFPPKRNRIERLESAVFKGDIADSPVFRTNEHPHGTGAFEDFTPRHANVPNIDAFCAGNP